MKRSILLIWVLTFSLNLFSQTTTKDVFKEGEIVWFGLDFSQAKFIGQFVGAQSSGPLSAQDLKQNMMPLWNGVIINEPLRYNIPLVFRKTSVYNDIEMVANRNKTIDENTMLSVNQEKREIDVNVMVSSYTKGEKAEGLGLVFIVDYFNKINIEAAVIVTFFDIKTKKVLFSESITAKPRGFGLRNYWAGAIYSIFMQINKTQFDSWKQKLDN
ncbi:MAG: hypothetical protein JW798_14175 [Prolixibacteraceae bacterium]|nr:hypothetical protein [Prolixibacteraceae bacterium]